MAVLADSLPESMQGLLETVTRHRDLLLSAGWLWEQQAWEIASHSVQPERLLIARAILDRWLTHNPKGFRITSGALFGSRLKSSLSVLTDILSWKHNLLLIAVADETTGSHEEVGSFVAPLLRTDPQIAGRLIALMIKGVPESGLTFPDRMLERCLQITEDASCLDRLGLFIVQLLRHHNRRIRSKAALLLARANGNPTLVYQRFARETDARVRANLIEGLWKVDAPGKAEVLWKAVNDSNHRVVANALVGLCEMGESKAAEQLEEFTRHPSEAMRAAAAWAMGEALNPRYADTLNRMFREEQRTVKRSALRALVRLRQAQQPAA